MLPFRSNIALPQFRVKHKLDKVNWLVNRIAFLGTENFNEFFLAEKYFPENIFKQA